MSVEWILSSSGLILLVLLIRFFCRKKMPPRLRYALWMVVALRLLFPVSVSETAVSILNLLPDQNTAEEGQESRIGQILYEKSGEAGSAEPASCINGWRISTTMSGSARQMKERLRMIVNTPVRTAGIRIFTLILVVLLAAVTFSGWNGASPYPDFHGVAVPGGALSVDGTTDRYSLLPDN